MCMVIYHVAGFYAWTLFSHLDSFAVINLYYINLVIKNMSLYIKQLLSQKVTKYRFLTTLIKRSCLIQKEHCHAWSRLIPIHAIECANEEVEATSENLPVKLE